MLARLPFITLRTAQQPLFFQQRKYQSTLTSDQSVSQIERVNWLKKFQLHLQTTSSLLPKEWISTNFSRSSGPGGQNVNKVNTKAEVRLDLGAASKQQGEEVPSMSKEVIRYLTDKSPYYIISSHSLLISSTKTRKQSDNLQDALEKMQSHLLSLLSQDIRGETSKNQQNRVKSLIAKDKIKTKKLKEKRGSVKAGRKSVSLD